MFIQLPLGIQLHAYSGDNWSHFKACVVNGRNEDGTQRETAIQAGFKSDHLVEALGQETTDDVAVINGTIYHGRIVRGIDGDVHRITAVQIAARREYERVLKEARRTADQAAFTVTTAAEPEAVAA